MCDIAIGVERTAIKTTSSDKSIKNTKQNNIELKYCRCAQYACTIFGCTGLYILAEDLVVLFIRAIGGKTSS